MKIFQIIPDLGMGGAETMCETLSYQLQKSGNKVTVVSLYNKETVISNRLKKNGIDVLFLDKHPGIHLSVISDLFRLFKSEKPDVVHTHLYTPKYAIAAAIMADIKVRVHTVHNIADKECGKYDRFTNKIFFKYFNTVPVALSRIIHDSILKVYNLSKTDVPIVFNGVDFSKCISKKSYSYNEVFTIIHVGRFSEQKNHKGLIEAFNRFHRKHVKTRLWLVGDGILKDRIKDLVISYGLENCVDFLGQRDDIFNLLNKADLFTLPSLYEGLPISILEAMGTGIPIVATRVGGVKDILNSSNSILTEINEEEVADAFETYYLNYELRRKHGLKLLSERDLYSDKNMALKYIDLYESR